MISSESLINLLSSNAKDFDVFIYDSVTSTNDLAKEYAKNHPCSTGIFIASNQTAGRGRRGRSFFSPDKTGLYMSILLRSQSSPQITSLLTPYAALCISRAIDKISDKEAKIKWINDVYIDGKKVSGVLCESSFSSDANKLEYLVVGIGINLSEPENGFPNEIKDIATTVFGTNTPSDQTIEKLCSSIINDLADYSLNIESKRFIPEYKNKLCMLGNDVMVITPNETYLAKAIDIDANAHLVVSLPCGTKRTLDAGEISIKTNFKGENSNG